MFLDPEGSRSGNTIGEMLLSFSKQSWWHNEQCSERVEYEGRRVREEVGLEVEEVVVTEAENRMKVWGTNK